MSSTNNTSGRKAAVQAIEQINRVEGFDPNPLAVEYTDEKTQEKRLRLPVMAQMAWFRLKYPTGKVIVRAQQAGKVFVGEARVYMNATDPDECCLASATASRGFDEDKPKMSPREWVQTAALGIALRNAGFGLQFHAAGDSFDHNAVNELETDMPVSGQSVDQPAETMKASAPETDASDATAESGLAPAESALSASSTAEAPVADPYEKAMSVLCPIAKYKGKTLGEVLMLDQKAIIYISNASGKYSEETVAAAKVICEYAAQQSA